MTRRTFDDWKILVDKQNACGLSIPQFCRQHNLNPTYFYSRKSMVHAKSNEGMHILMHRDHLIPSKPIT